MAPRAGHKVVVSDFDLLGVFARKSADETVTSSTTLQNDDQLFVPVAANAVYLMDALFFYSGSASGTNGSLKLGWTGPSGATMRWNNFANNAGAAGETQYNISTEPIGGTPRQIQTIGAGNIAACRPSGTLVVAGTSGNFQLQWAQWSSSATGTIIHANSTIRLFRIA